MDPAATLFNILIHLEDVAHMGEDDITGNKAATKADAKQACLDLANWLHNGGFAPDAAKVARKFLERVE